eukprot:g7670.t1
MAPNGNTVAAADPAAAAPGVDGSKHGSAWSRFHARINESADNFFYRLGRWVATYPKRTLFVCVVLVIACCFGFANFRLENDGEELWVPADSTAKKQQSIFVDNFIDNSEYASLLLESPTESDSVLTKERFDALWDLHDIVLTLNSGDQTYQDVCARDLDGSCELPFRGATRFWDSRANYDATVATDADILEAINVEAFPDGVPVNQQAIFGNTIEYDDSGSIVFARALFQAYGLMSDPDADADINEDAFDWNGEFQDAMEEAAPDFADTVNVFYITSRSIDDALAESIGGEIVLFVATYVIMVNFVTIALGRCRSGPVERRMWIGGAAVISVVAAALAAYGLNSAFAVPFTSLSQILPFILVGIGVDDAFVIVAAFDHTDPSLPVVERVALGVKRCGVSITYTSLTNFFAFLLGSQSALPAVQYFCLYASVSILFDFFLQMTAFVAVLTMDANRQKAGRVDCCCCFTSKKYLAQQEEGIRRGVDLTPGNTIVPTAAAIAGTTVTPAGGIEHDVKAEVHELSRIGKFMKDKYAPHLLSGKGKAVVLLGSAALLAAGIDGVVKATQGFDVLDLVPDDHYSRDYTELTREYEVDISEWYVPLNIVTREVDYADVTVQAEILDTDQRMLEEEYVVGPLDSWLSSFIEWAGASTEYSTNVGMSGDYMVYNDRATFYSAVAEFVVDGDNARFESDVVFNDDGTILISRSDLYLIDLTDTTKNVDALKGSRDVVDETALDPKPFAFSGVFVFSESFVVIYKELLTSFGLALVAVLALSLLVLGKVTVVLLVCLTVFIIDVELLGFVYHWGLDVNTITVVQLIMAVGLVVDYMVHIVHYFLHQDPSISKDLRIANALGEIGPSVLVGVMTTFLGIMPLVFASNAIFRTFFRMFLVIISFGFFHGVVFIPVMLSILPDRLVTNHAQKGSAIAASGDDDKAAPAEAGATSLP